jgi:hypothetical protein
MNTTQNSIDNNYQLTLLINRLYTASKPYTTHSYSDMGWENAQAHIAALRTVKGVKDVISSAGVYYNYFAGTSPDINRPAYRKYDLTIETEYGTLEGQLICHSAGSVDDVFSRYDMTCSFWKQRNRD